MTTNAIKKREFVKLPLMEHQRLAIRKAWKRKGFAYLMEQGTGKTLALVAEALALYAEGLIDGMIVFAPNGVHYNWILNELPQYIPDDVSWVAAAYSNDQTRKEKAKLDALMHPRAEGDVPPFRVLAMSYDSLLVDRGFKFAEAFVMCVRCMVVADEAHKIKNADARRSKRALNIRRHCPYRRIATGTAIANSPVDAFAEFEFLDEGLLGETSITAFRARYCELLPPNHGVMRHIVSRMERASGRQMSDAEKAKRTPQIIDRDAQGRPKYKNLDELHDRIAAHSYRVLKEDCMELPPKQYETLYFHLTKAQRAVYDRMVTELRYILEDGRMLATSKLVAMSKLRQITSGFLLLRDGSVSYLEDNPRVALLHESLEDETQPGVIWSQYREEQRSVARVLSELKMTHEVVNGATPVKRRREIMAEFQAGNLQWIDAHPATMGSGFTLTHGTLNYYYSNGFDMVERVQSEDRTHRKGTRDTVMYRDFVAIDTRDDDVVWALQHKLDTAAMINGDPARKSRFQERTEGADA